MGAKGDRKKHASKVGNMSRHSNHDKAKLQLPISLNNNHQQASNPISTTTFNGFICLDPIVVLPSAVVDVVVVC